MSARSAAAVAAPTIHPRQAPARPAGPRLEVVRAPAASRSRVPFVVLCMSILGGALLCALLLNTSMANGSFRMLSDKVELGTVAQDTQTLQTQLEQARATLPERARALGMQEADQPVMLRLADGAVLDPGGEK
ncbi:hypothetical protein [Cellulomonas sp. PhB143]|uniref:hypothetical protein n=1 Tax=Cellulomonas sp. PhB143 TaxID=2485186 RepID=UPI000FAB1398|nr:hypothetical protein [Cellulomonas sp. PhB143]ROS77206.1 hypothetical protein EDF32_1204 [Cellulomonas sp. PhB143]